MSSSTTSAHSVVLDGAIFALERSGGVSRMWADYLLGLDAHLTQDDKAHLLIPRNRNVEWARVKPLLKNIRIVPRRRLKKGRHGYRSQQWYLELVAWRYRPKVWHSAFYVGFPKRNVQCRIQTFHDMASEKMGPTEAFDHVMKYSSLRQSDVILSVSENSLNDLNTLMPHLTAKKHVVHIGLPEQTPCSVHTPPPFPYFIFAGKRDGHKAFKDALQAILPSLHLNRYHIVVVGGNEAWDPEEEALIAKFRAQDRIHKRGVMSRDQLQALLKGAEAILYPSHYEGFGIPVLEAFQMEVPILACRTSSIPEVAGEEYPLADPGSLVSLEQTLLKLLNEREAWVSYGTRRLRDFSLHKMVKKTTELYSSN